MKTLKDYKEAGHDWKTGLEVYEKSHKPRADLIQSFSNLTGCGQSQQKEILTKELVTQMQQWINSADDTYLPPEHELNTIRSFDPLSEDGVSLI